MHGCHLKGPFGGILLFFVSLDANKGMFPIVVAMIEIENKDSWRYFFFTLLKEALKFVPEWKDDSLTIMFDMQKVGSVMLTFNCYLLHLIL